MGVSSFIIDLRDSIFAQQGKKTCKKNTNYGNLVRKVRNF